jgi:cyclic pyranopterin phosphate synthase
MRSSHIDEHGNAVMIDISDKNATIRVATAEGRIRVSPAVMEAVKRGAAAKGDVLGVARIAGIMGAKQTSALIPLCHPLPLSHCTIQFESENESIRAVCTVKTASQTGVEMEALTGVSLALLTIYDMCKSMEKGMEITGIRLLEKTGGKNGDYKRS